MRNFDEDYEFTEDEVQEIVMVYGSVQKHLGTIGATNQAVLIALLEHLAEIIVRVSDGPVDAIDGLLFCTEKLEHSIRDHERFKTLTIEDTNRMLAEALARHQ